MIFPLGRRGSSLAKITDFGSVACDLRLAVLDQVRFRDSLPRPKDDDGAHDFTPVLVLHADYGYVLHALVRRECLFDFAGIDVCRRR